MFCLKGDLLIQIWLYECIKLDNQIFVIIGHLLSKRFLSWFREYKNMALWMLLKTVFFLSCYETSGWFSRMGECEIYKLNRRSWTRRNWMHFLKTIVLKNILLEAVPTEYEGWMIGWCIYNFYLLNTLHFHKSNTPSRINMWTNQIHLVCQRIKYI